MLIKALWHVHKSGNFVGMFRGQKNNKIDAGYYIEHFYPN
jgi:hypothetical protein